MIFFILGFLSYVGLGLIWMVIVPSFESFHQVRFGPDAWNFSCAVWNGHLEFFVCGLDRTLGIFLCAVWTGRLEFSCAVWTGRLEFFVCGLNRTLGIEFILLCEPEASGRLSGEGFVFPFCPVYRWGRGNVAEGKRFFEKVFRRNDADGSDDFRELNCRAP
ncbi:MAG: hypothetical protein HUJ69_09865 [Lachnospiraceae bacterium]|nr:hypothetical protein [Lachnospiraceae bacterium]